MRTEHRTEGITTYVYSHDAARTDANIAEVRQSVDRIETLCRDILTALSLLIDLLPEAHAKPDEDTGL